MKPVSPLLLGTREPLIHSSSVPVFGAVRRNIIATQPFLPKALPSMLILLLTPPFLLLSFLAIKGTLLPP
jgi:hypothetical protein